MSADLAALDAELLAIAAEMQRADANTAKVEEELYQTAQDALYVLRDAIAFALCCTVYCVARESLSTTAAGIRSRTTPRPRRRCCYRRS